MPGHSYFNQYILILCIVILNYYKLILMELMFISKHITSKYIFFVIKSNIILMILSFTVKCCIYSEYKEFIHDISGSIRDPG